MGMGSFVWLSQCVSQLGALLWVFQHGGQLSHALGRCPTGQQGLGYVEALCCQAGKRAAVLQNRGSQAAKSPVLDLLNERVALLRSTC